MFIEGNCYNIRGYMGVSAITLQ
ncbi:hypothetical protein MTR67_041930 [Solanum verrucosum]|uniref:Uncharacterized protein n=1 Tax=Solanum verrucosum TaxID=315347 RepID=A0AAF0ZT83_SOLVR|nr:hypothetical protein MTR67_041930 [Solanum verrucosum]